MLRHRDTRHHCLKPTSAVRRFAKTTAVASVQVCAGLTLLLSAGCNSDSDRPPRDVARHESHSTSDPTFETSSEDEVVDPAPISLVDVKGEPVSVDAEVLVTAHEVARMMREEGCSSAEIDAAELVLSSGSRLRLSDLLDAVDARAAASEAEFGRIKYSSTPGDRGYGGVLTVGKVPRKVMPRSMETYIQDEKGLPLRLMKPGLPYFVFEDNGSHLKVGTEQDQDLALGWVPRRDCYPWPSRRLVYPDAELPALADLFGEGTDGKLPSFQASSVMPWPILGNSDERKQITVLADLRPLGGEVLPVKLPQNDKLVLYVLFTSKELDGLLTKLTELIGLLDSKKLSVEATARVLGKFLTQNQVDFRDFREVQRVVDLFPGGTPKLIRSSTSDFVFRDRLKNEINMLIKSLRKHLTVLTDLATANEFYNESRGIYIFPLTHLESIESKGDLR